jgi:3-oxoadipate enol-lactonase
MTMQWLDLGGTCLRVRDNGGTGPLLVLVHELGGSIETWDEVVPHLAPRYRILRFDFRGCGMSQKLTGPVTLKELAGDVPALLDALHIGGPALIAGCAVGGAIAAGFAAWWPQRVAKLILFSPSLGVPPAVRAERRAGADRMEREGMHVAEEAAFSAGYPETLRKPAVFAQFRARWLGNDPRSQAHLMRMLIDLESDDLLHAIRCPTLAVGCSHDMVRPPAYVEGVSRLIANCSFVTIPTSHHAPVQTPELIAQTIDGFFSRKADAP